MKTRGALRFLGTVCMALATANVYAQTHSTSPGKDDEKNFMQAGIGFQGGVWVTITTFEILPDGTKERGNVAGGVAAGKERIIHRHIEMNNVCYGYDLAVEPSNDSDVPRFRVSFRPLDPEWAKQENARVLTYNKKACTLLSLPELPEPQMVADVDTISLEILSNPQTGAKIVDAIKVGWPKEDTHKPKTGKQ